jgi:putative aldouronate transport system permease protein
VNSGQVGLWPKGFTLSAYKYVLKQSKFWTSIIVTLKRMFIGIPLTLILTILMAYPLSKPEYIFPARKYYVAFFMVTMIFSGGLVPTYMLVHSLGLFDTVWALVLPGAVNVFNAILVMNFFRGLPRAIEESAIVDGAGQFTVMMRIILPLSKASIATITLFSIIGNWNAWYDGLLYNNYTEHYPLQTYLQTLLTSSTDLSTMMNDIKNLMERQAVTARNLTAAQIFISIVPLMCAYPFLQKYFAKGLVMGSVKG